MSGASGKVSGQGAGDRIRQPVSIEQLLVWAYAEQMVHEAQRRDQVVRRKGDGPLAAYSSLWSEGGTPIDSSTNLGFGAADDAWAVHDRVLKLGRITVDCGLDLAATRYHASPLYRGHEPPVDVAGTADRIAQAWPEDGQLEIKVRSLVMIHASQATRPDRPVAAKWRLKPVHKGMVRHPSSKGGAYRFGWYHHVEVEGVTPGEAREVLEIYQAWWNALDALRAQLAGVELTMFALTAEMPPRPKVQSAT